MTRESILDAAERLFIERGYNGARVSEVSREAGVSIGSIYVHFENKEGLYSALMERAISVETKYFDAVFDDPEISDVEKLVAVGEAYLQFLRDYPAYFRMLMMPHEDVPEEATDTPVGRQVVARGLHQRERLTEVIRRCVEQGLARDDIDPENAANFWWAAWNGVVSLTMRRDDLQLSPDKLEEVIIEGRLMTSQGLATSVLRLPDGSLIPELHERVRDLRERPSVERD